MSLPSLQLGSWDTLHVHVILPAAGPQRAWRYRRQKRPDLSPILSHRKIWLGRKGRSILSCLPHFPSPLPVQWSLFATIYIAVAVAARSFCEVSLPPAAKLLASLQNYRDFENFAPVGNWVLILLIWLKKVGLTLNAQFWNSIAYIDGVD